MSKSEAKTVSEATLIKRAQKLAEKEAKAEAKRVEKENKKAQKLAETQQKPQYTCSICNVSFNDTKQAIARHNKTKRHIVNQSTASESEESEDAEDVKDSKLTVIVEDGKWTVMDESKFIFTAFLPLEAKEPKATVSNGIYRIYNAGVCVFKIALEQIKDVVPVVIESKESTA